MGVRPEDVCLDATGDLPGRVEQVEPLGAETVVVVQVGGARLHALMPGLARVDAGAATRVTVSPGAVLYFAADGRRLAA